VPFSRTAGVSAPSRKTPCSVKVSVVPDGAVVVARRMMPGCIVPGDVTDQDIADDMTVIVNQYAESYGLDAEGLIRVLQMRTR